MKFACLLFPLLLCASDAPSVGPAHGSLLIVGGGRLTPEIVAKFVELAGGPDSSFVLVPTAGEKNDYGPQDADSSFLKKAGLQHISVLHTRDRKVADSEEFVKPLRQARGVWFAGGRQWRLVDSYLGTRFQREVDALLERGGVVGGSSAGATIQGSYLVRGAREGNSVMMAPGYERGFGLLRQVAVDQHLLTRRRENDLLPVIDAHPELLGIGIDESTAIVVHGDQFEVIGATKVAIYDKGYQPAESAPRYYFLEAGARYDLKKRARIP